ncbi:hypothetical protein JFL47_09400 [Haemophilus haemoglobinophilus]|nr:hypothetical protein [Canicola haemoglobinophilus]
MKKTLVALAVASLAISSSQFNSSFNFRYLTESKPPKPRMDKQAIYKNQGKK